MQIWLLKIELFPALPSLCGIAFLHEGFCRGRHILPSRQGSPASDVSWAGLQSLQDSTRWFPDKCQGKAGPAQSSLQRLQLRLSPCSGGAQGSDQPNCSRNSGQCLQQPPAIVGFISVVIHRFLLQPELQGHSGQAALSAVFAHMLSILKWDGWIFLCAARGVSDQEGILIFPHVSLPYTESNSHILKGQCIFMIPFLRSWRICLKFKC